MSDHNKFIITLQYIADLCNALILMLNVIPCVIGLGLTRPFYKTRIFDTFVYRSVSVTKE